MDMSVITRLVPSPYYHPIYIAILWFALLIVVLVDICEVRVLRVFSLLMNIIIHASDMWWRVNLTVGICWYR